MHHSSLSRLVAVGAVAGVLFVPISLAQAQCGSRSAHRGVASDRIIFMSASAETAPPPHARIVSRTQHASPDFLLPTGQMITRTPAGVDERYRTSPTRFGLPADTDVRIPVRIGWLVIPLDPFTRLDAESHSAFRAAKTRWLKEQGLVGQARIIRRADSLPNEIVETDRVMTAAGRSELPKPRATIELNRRPIQRKGYHRLEARLDSTGQHLTLISSNHILAESATAEELATALPGMTEISPQEAQAL